MADASTLTMSEVIARSLRQDLMFGKIRAGTRITQEDLSAQFLVSRMPARDAMRQLLAEGFLRQDGRVVRVASLSEADVREMIEIDAVLHGLAARGAAANSDPGFHAELADLERAFRADVIAGDLAAAASSNWQLHRLINRNGASQHLRSVLRFISTPREHLAEATGDLEQLVVEHSAIVKAILEGRAADAQAAAYAHVMRSIDDRVNHLRSIDAIRDPPQPIVELRVGLEADSLADRV